MADRIERMVRLEGCTFEEIPLVPVPTTPRRLRVRGYNQAERLARALSPRLRLPVLEALARREGGKSQVSLDPVERRANVRSAFHLLPDRAGGLRGKEVVLVDDVLTTGATALAVTETLIEGGASGVHLLTFARALPE
jgi:ComF family protein